MLIAIISDTHSREEKIKEVLDLIQEKKAEAIFHAGDWDTMEVLNLFEKIKIPVYGVLGNCDRNLLEYQTLIKENPELNQIELQNRELEKKIQGKKFLVTHGHDEYFLENAIKANDYQVVISGHTHKPEIEKIGKTLHINPGSVFGFYGRPIRKPVASSLAFYDIIKNKAEIFYF
jgi:hypothetical protein